MVFKDIKTRREWFNKRRAETRAKIWEIKKRIGKCSECGWNVHWEILQFHHREKEKKDFKFSAGNFGNYNFEKILKEIEKCDLICPNCHYWKHYNEKEWFIEQNNKNKYLKKVMRRADEKDKKIKKIKKEKNEQK